MLFEWNETKARQNWQKHRVSFEEAATVFEDPGCVEVPDEAHSTATEVRSFRIGRSLHRRILLVVFTERGHNHGEEIIRIISARPATKKEREAYVRAHDV